MIESARPTSDSDEVVSISSMSTYSPGDLQALAGQVTDLSWSGVPAEVQDRTLLVLFDTLGVMLAGAGTSEVQAFAAQFEDTGASVLVGFGRTSSSGAACWVNGASVCSLELDEGSKYSRGHPAAHVIPAALAIAAGHSGSDWLAAVLGGYETAARFGRATRLAPGVHPHGTWGATGAAAAAARLGGLDSERVAAAMDAAAGLTLAPHFESALTGNPVRNLWVGSASNAGVAAARLAAAGVAVAAGTAAFTFGEILGEFDSSPLAVPFEDRFEILGGYFKRHAACAYTHPSADAILALRAEGLIDTEEVEEIVVETYRIAATLDRTEFPTRLSAMFSIPYVVAVTLLDGAFGPDATSEARREEPVVQDLARKVRVEVTDEYEARLPDRRGARVTVRLRGGSDRSAAVEQPIGDSAHQPLGWDAIRNKLRDLIGADRTIRLEKSVSALPREPVDELIEELTRS